MSMQHQLYSLLRSTMHARSSVHDNSVRHNIRYGTGNGIRKKAVSLLVLTAMVFSLVFNALGIATPLTGGSVYAAAPAAQTAGANIAYVVDADRDGAAAFSGLLSAAGHTMTTVVLGNVLSTDFSQFDLTIVAHDTGYLSDWGNAAGQVEHIAKDSKVLGLGEGGYAFFGQLQMNIGWPNGWHGALDSVMGEASLSFYQSPNDVTPLLTGPLQLYTQAVGEVGIYHPEPVASVRPLGREPNSVHHYPLIAERCHQLWGFAGTPDEMTATGKDVFINAVDYSLNLCVRPTEPNCFELFRPEEVPAPALIDFDDLAAPAAIDAHYQSTYGVTFAAEHVAVEAPDIARSAPNVAVNTAQMPVTGGPRPPLKFAFDSGKTHVGFFMGRGDEKTAAIMIGYDGNGQEVCRVNNSPVPEEVAEFIGMYDPQGRIVAVELSYGRNDLNETIDNLYFAPHTGRPTGEFPTPEEPVFGGRNDVAIEVLKSSNEGFAAQVAFPDPHLVPIQGPDGQEYVQFMMPGVENRDGMVGHPDVPVLHRILAVPRGAKANLLGVRYEVGEKHEARLYPVQPSPADAGLQQEDEDLGSMPRPEVFMDLPFEFDKEAYAADRPFPRAVVQVEHLGTLRDLDVVQVSVAAGQYNPRFEALQLFQSVEFEIEFSAGEEWFLPGERIDNPFERSFDAIYAQVLNHRVIWEYVGPIITDIIWVCAGEEYIIITDPEFRSAADDLRAWKVTKGIATSVFETGTPTVGTTNTEIRDFIRYRYNNCLVRPSYVLFLGDAEHIPPFYLTTHYGDSAGTDLPYAQMSFLAILPELAVGRMPVDTLDQARIVVDKTIAYEQSPPHNSAFYSNISIASYFQCCHTGVPNPGTTSRSFIETSELIRNALENSYNYGVERIYSTSTVYHTNYTGDTTPRRYRNGALLPAALGGASGFPWNGGTNDVVDAVNEGRFLMMHRGHGGVNGWASPSFRSNHLPNLDNGALTPIMYSINCASGLWDNETLDPNAQNWNYGTSVNGSYWAERILRQEGGAVGVIGDTRNSPTWANSALARGLFDATFPNVLPNTGSNTSIRRLGDIMNYGKVYMANQIGVAQTAGSVSQAEALTNIVLYHTLGDPTLEMWTSNPYQIILPNFYIELQKEIPDFWQMRYPIEGAVITALQDGKPVARGLVQNGVAELAFIDDAIDGDDPDNPISLSASHPAAPATPLKGPRAGSTITPEEGGRTEDPESGISIRIPTGAVREPVSLLLTDHITDVIVYPIPEHTKSLLHLLLEARTNDGNVYPQFDQPFEVGVKYGQTQAASTAEVAQSGTWCEELGCDTVPNRVDTGEIQCHLYDEEESQWTLIETDLDREAEEVICRGDRISEMALLQVAPAQEPGAPMPFGLFMPALATE